MKLFILMTVDGRGIATIKNTYINIQFLKKYNREFFKDLKVKRIL